MPPKRNAQKMSTGPPQELISRIAHLHQLLCNLPKELPENPPHSLYSFNFDKNKLEMGGYFAAAGHALELSFETHLLTIQGRRIRFSERGERHVELQKFLKKAVKEMTPGERDSFRQAWIERLITAAVESGAKIPSKKRKEPPDDDGVEAPPAKKTPQTHPESAPLPSSSSSTSAATTSSAPPFLPSSSSAASQARQLVGNPKQRGLDSFGWKKASKEEVQLYWSKEVADAAEQRQIMAEVKEQKDEEKKERERDLARLRKQRQRERQKQENDNGGTADLEDANTVLMRGASAMSKENEILDVASLSRPHTQDWKKQRNGKLGGVVHAPAKKVFWFHPFLFTLIKAALARHDWSPSRTVAYLQRTHPALFDAPGSRLNKGTLWRWIVPGQHCFTESALLKISGRRSLTFSGRTGILAPYPDMIAHIVKTLLDVRKSGCVVNVVIARSLMIAIIREQHPELLDRFTCSEKFVRAFLDSKLNWSSRKATRAAKHIPDDASQLCERTFFRLVYAIEHEHIPAKVHNIHCFKSLFNADTLVVASDQLRPDRGLHSAKS